MSRRKLTLSVIAGHYAVHRFEAKTPLPSAALRAPLFAVVRTADELSVVVPESLRLNSPQVERGWACFRVNGPLDLNMIGVMADLSGALAAAGISLFAISTYDTDYLLVRAAQMPRARRALARAGFRFVRPA